MTERLGGTVYIVGTPIGNLEDMSYRAVRILREANIVAAEDTRAAQRLFAHYDIRGPRVRSFFSGNEAARTAELVAELGKGRTVAVISEAGMPGISDPGQRLVRAAIADGHNVEVIPGPVAAAVALVASGLDSARFVFLGFPPRQRGAREQLFGSLRAEVSTMILYEAPDRVARTLADLAAALGPERPAALARELTKRYEEIRRGGLGELSALYRERPPRGECTLVVAGASADGGVGQGDGAPGIPAAAAADDIEQQMRALLDQGLGPRDAAARLVVKTGKPRRQLYQLALSLRRDPGRRDGS